MWIREATEADLEQVLAIERQSFPRPWSESLLKRFLKQATLLVCEEQGQVIGFLIGELDPPGHTGPLGHVVDLAVAPAHRRMGVGTRLLEAFLALCRRAGATGVYLEVRVGNTAAIRFYETNGFTKMRRIPQFYEDGQEALLMEQELRDKL